MGAHHVLGDRGFGNVDPELQQLSVNSGCSPKRISRAHFTDKVANFGGKFRFASPAVALPCPEQAKTFAMPADHGLWFDDHKS